MSNIKKLDYQQLIVFETLFEERSVTKTAKRLQLKQPTVSGILRKLRILFDDPIFIRSQRGVTPTVRAESMVDQVRDIIERMESLGADPVFDPTAETRHYSIVARDFSQVVVIAPFVSILESRFPHISIAVYALPMTEAVEKMETGSIDLSVSSLRYAPDHAHQRILFKEPYVCVVDAASHLAKKQQLTLQDLEKHHHISAAAMSLAVGDPVDDMFRRQGITRVVKVAVDGYLLVPRLLSGTEYIAVVPKSLVAHSSFALKAFKMPIDFPQIEIALLWHKRVQKDPGNVWLRDQLLEVCKTTRSQ